MTKLCLPEWDTGVLTELAYREAQGSFVVCADRSLVSSQRQ